VELENSCERAGIAHHAGAPTLDQGAKGLKFLDRDDVIEKRRVLAQARGALNDPGSIQSCYGATDLR
jgi:hypothetical protein